MISADVSTIIEVVIKEVAMIGGTERLLEARRAGPADRQKSIGEAEALPLTNARQPLAKGNRAPPLGFVLPKLGRTRSMLVHKPFLPHRSYQAASYGTVQ